MIRIVRLIDNVNMGLGHPGLALLCKERFKLDLEKLQDSELVMFLNRARDKMKIIGSQGKVLGYLRMPRGERIMLEAIQYLPKTFGGSGFSYDSALKEALEQRLAHIKQKALGPLEAFRTAKKSGVAA
jgi:hypothetical protein